MSPLVQMFITVIVALIGSSGFWITIQLVIQKRRDQKLQEEAENSNFNKMVLGLVHTKILELGNMYIDRGYITPEEYEDLHDYLYLPYQNEGGNGAAKRVMDIVDTLPFKKSDK